MIFYSLQYNQQSNIEQIMQEEGSSIQSSHHLTDRHKNPLSPPTKQDDQQQRSIKIPLISKRMNSVEKYVTEFYAHTVDVNKTKQDKDSSQTNKNEQKQKPTHKDMLNHSHSADISSLMEQDGLTPISSKFCLNYSSIMNQKSQDKMEVLGKLQKDYLLLKKKMQPHIKHINSLADGLNYKTLRIADISEQEITPEEVQKQIKNSIINQDGRKYYADLYLLKKGRDKIINSLSNVGKLSLQGNSHQINDLTYEEKLRANEENYVKGKIIRQRQAKKAKMMKGRNLHWNVYYDMLALSANEKKKLKGICKFTSTFGIA